MTEEITTDKISKRETHAHVYLHEGDYSEIKKWLEENSRISSYREGVTFEELEKGAGYYIFEKDKDGNEMGVLATYPNMGARSPIPTRLICDMELPKSLLNKLNLKEWECPEFKPTISST